MKLIKDYSKVAGMKLIYTLVRMSKIQNNNNTESWQGHEAMWIVFHCWWERTKVQPLWTMMNEVVSHRTKHFYHTIQQSHYLELIFTQRS